MDDRPWCALPPMRWADAVATAGRQRRARATRRSLLLAASRLIDERGYHGASLHDVALTAGTTKGAVYFHFDSKRALAQALALEATASWDDLVARVLAHGHDPLRALMLCYDAYTARLMHDALSRAVVRVSADTDVARTLGWGQRWLEASTGMLAQARAEGLLAGHVDPSWLSRHLLATAFGHFTLLERAGDLPHLWDRMNELWSGLLPTIASTTWLESWRRSGWADRPVPSPDHQGHPDVVVAEPIVD